MPQQAKKKNKTAQNNCSYTFSVVNACMYNCCFYGVWGTGRHRTGCYQNGWRQCRKIDWSIGG